ncbi:protein-arginine deiminase family protein [Pseudanabaena sp. FACHB-2040]|uniref:protein-arginine deiminase family protein n=1 Tax=Pseudanabaena sp. FACHB-2040 TaxID=2692859 RepID=UPI001687D67A|nr:protein-arginine deiminase family protein [Pseudanabaena sp. FACHB-2040]MBD2259132.1 protein-arginine deiminase [Pseudanabaena sp. FACHB-2040]
MRNLLQLDTSNELRLSREKSRSYEDILVVGQPLQISLKDLAPTEDAVVSFKTWGEIELYFDLELNQQIDTQTAVPLAQLPEIALLARTFSDRLKDRSLEITFQDDSGHELSQVQLDLTCLRVCLDVDANRDGIVDDNNPHKGDWRWGTSGHGAILITSTDRDHVHSDSRYDSNKQLRGLPDLKDSSFMIVRRVGLRDLPSGCEVYLSVSRDTAQRICIYDDLAKTGYELISPNRLRAKIRDTDRDILLAIKGISYPDFDFDGLVEVYLDLVKGGETIHSDRVVFRIAPWIVTPNTLDPITVFVSRLSKAKNEGFIEDLRKVASQANVQIDPVPYEFHKDDPWMRDEIEIGYAQAPGKFIHVVLDSPRDRGLDHLTNRQLIGSDFGYVIRKSCHPVTKLDSFGNLEVSPPVTVNGVEYPFGRLIFGGTRPEVVEDPRRKLKVLRDFFYAQKIQAPFEIFSDWLSVGHIDEFMNFVPAPDGKGFKLLLASPNKCYDLLKQLRDKGHSQTLLRQGKCLYQKPADISVADVLDNSELASHNQRFQECINWNREALQQELGLEEDDIIELPALYDDDDGRAEAFFPNMVNMLVLKQHLAIPKPFGPQVEGQCQFEAYVERVLGPLGLACHFIDDWDPYFREGGEIHCGTNANRQPFAQNWWEVEPEYLAQP